MLLCLASALEEKIWRSRRAIRALPSGKLFAKLMSMKTILILLLSSLAAATCLATATSSATSFTLPFGTYDNLVPECLLQVRKIVDESGKQFFLAEIAKSPEFPKGASAYGDLKKVLNEIKTKDVVEIKGPYPTYTDEAYAARLYFDEGKVTDVFFVRRFKNEGPIWQSCGQYDFINDKTPRPSSAVSSSRDSLENKIKKIGTIYGGIDDFYFKNDTLSDATRMQYSDKIWRCIPYKGQLPEYKTYDGITIRSSNCPINYVRGFNAALSSGFAEYTTKDSEILDLLNVSHWRADFNFKSETKENFDTLNYQIKTDYNFTDNEKIQLTVDHELKLARDNKVADRVTHALFQSGTTSIRLTYQVHSDAAQIKKTCSVENLNIDCAEFYKRFGAIELIPNW